MSRSKANLRILSTADDDAAVWTGLFNRLPPQFQDIHFSVDYGRAYERSYGQQVLLAAYGDLDSYLLMPFVLRDVGRLPWVSNAAIEGPVYDISSLYAFGGPVARVRDEQADRRLHAGFSPGLHPVLLEQSDRDAVRCIPSAPRKPQGPSGDRLGRGQGPKTGGLD